MSKKVINARILSAASMIRDDDDDDDDDSLSPLLLHVNSTIVSQAIKSGRNPLSRRRKSLPCSYNNGRWSEQERYLFLLGLTKFGHGRWKQVGSILRTR
jgi:hypothetical protein